LVEISEAASFKLKNEKPSVSSSHCLSSTVNVIEGNGSTAASAATANHGYGYMGYSFAGYAGFVTDILDPFETSKYTTTRTLSGTTDGGNRVYLTSSNWRNTAALTSMQIINESGSFTTGSRFSLYGLRSA